MRLDVWLPAQAAILAARAAPGALWPRSAPVLPPLVFLAYNRLREIHDLGVLEAEQHRAIVEAEAAIAAARRAEAARKRDEAARLKKLKAEEQANATAADRELAAKNARRYPRGRRRTL